MRISTLSLFSAAAFIFLLSGCGASARVKKTQVAPSGLPGMGFSSQPVEAPSGAKQTGKSAADTLSNEELDAAITADRDGGNSAVKKEEGKQHQEVQPAVPKQPVEIAPKMIDLTPPSVNAGGSMTGTMAIIQANKSEENISNLITEAGPKPEIGTRLGLREQAPAPSMMQKKEPKPKETIKAEAAEKPVKTETAAPKETLNAKELETLPELSELESAKPARQTQEEPSEIEPAAPREAPAAKEPETLPELSAMGAPVEPARQVQPEPAAPKETLPAKEIEIPQVEAAPAPVEPARKAQPEPAVKPKPAVAEQMEPAEKTEQEPQAEKPVQEAREKITPAPEVSAVKKEEVPERINIPKEPETAQKKVKLSTAFKKKSAAVQAQNTEKLAKKEENIKQKKLSRANAETKHEARMHTVAHGDNLETLAEKYYQDKNMWVKIYEANKDKIEKGSLLMGQTIIIP